MMGAQEILFTMLASPDDFDGHGARRIAAGPLDTMHADYRKCQYIASPTMQMATPGSLLMPTVSDIGTAILPR